MAKLGKLRDEIRRLHGANEESVLSAMIAGSNFDEVMLSNTSEKGAEWVAAIRNDDKPGLMDVFLAEYGLSTDEGVALMCLAPILRC